MKKQVNIYYNGGVQGIGFRFTVENIAGDLGLYGWVKNLKDGRVEVVAEAEEETLKIFLERVREYFSRYIRDTDITWLEASGKLNEFRVEF